MNNILSLNYKNSVVTIEKGALISFKFNENE